MLLEQLHQCSLAHIFSFTTANFILKSKQVWELKGGTQENKHLEQLSTKLPSIFLLCREILQLLM
jgi:hypothetical protein